MSHPIDSLRQYAVLDGEQLERLWLEIDWLRVSIMSVLPENFTEDDEWMRLLETHGLMDQAMKEVTP